MNPTKCGGSLAILGLALIINGCATPADPVSSAADFDSHGNSKNLVQGYPAAFHVKTMEVCSEAGVQSPGCLSERQRQWLTDAENDNAKRWQRTFGAESAWYGKEAKGAGEDSNLPKTCLALSGGGIRSAAFSLGVLRELHESERLKDFSIVSGVSGGSYALSWFYVQQYLSKIASDNCEQQAKVGNGSVAEVSNVDQCGKPQALFNGGGSALTRLQNSAHFVTGFDYVGIGAGNIALIPANVVLNGVFGWHANTSYAADFYEDRIKDVFHSNEVADREIIYVSDIGKFAASSGLPYFIINATAEIDDGRKHYSARLSNSVFEFTPLYYGSDLFGRYAYRPENLMISRVVALSGAAVDLTRTTAGAAQQLLVSAFNFDLGGYIDNPQVADYERYLHKWLPFPLYLFHRQQRDANGVSIYLSDGGHSENLGAFSLIRRLCNEVIIVDGEHDYKYEFGAYFHLKESLRNEMGVDFEVPEIERLVKSEHSEPKNSLEFHKTSRWAAVGEAPLMKGDICCFPMTGRDGNVRVHYLKLAYHTAKACANGGDKEDLIRRYACRTVEGRRASLIGRVQAWLKNDVFYPFPQQSTADQDYSSDQFAAYSELGYQLAKKLPPARGNERSLVRR